MTKREGVVYAERVLKACCIVLFIVMIGAADRCLVQDIDRVDKRRLGILIRE